ncbi:hypothetical protein HZH66_007154 [Vespula vulgaris]|uniref:Uncharacterized protein n=2 Tax=Vespula TaxID=7451 RepID=A0A834JXK9_VESVU|nr:hypothetical protein HZH66_007154 [Vespula vulgaris]
MQEIKPVFVSLRSDNQRTRRRSLFRRRSDTLFPGSIYLLTMDGLPWSLRFMAFDGPRKLGLGGACRSFELHEGIHFGWTEKIHRVRGQRVNSTEVVLVSCSLGVWKQWRKGKKFRGVEHPEGNVPSIEPMHPTWPDQDVSDVGASVGNWLVSCLADWLAGWFTGWLTGW